MKRATLMSIICGFALTAASCAWADDSASIEANATRVSVNPQTTGSANADLLEPATGTAASDVKEIQNAIDKFSFLFEGENADRLKHGIWPSMTPRQYRSMKETFEVVSQVTLCETCLGSPEVAGDSAAWTCNEMLGYSVSGMPRPRQTHRVRFGLKKLDGAWYVDSRTGK